MSTTDTSKKESTTKIVVITGAAGRIAYSLIPLICSGQVFGTNVLVELRLLDMVMAADRLQGVAMELEDCNFPLLVNCTATLSAEEAFRGADVAVLLGGFPRLQGMERKDLITKNAEGMREQAQAIDRFAKSSIKVCIVANPANTNCLVAMKFAPSVPPENFTCLTRLDEERLRGFVLQKARGKGVSVATALQIKDMSIWGNHSATQVPYIDCGYIEMEGGTKLQVAGLYSEDEKKELISLVQNRGAAIISKQQASSGLSAANAIANHLSDWLNPGVPVDKVFSMGVLSTGNPYGVPDGLVYSFPLRRTGGGEGGFEIVKDLPVGPHVRAMLNASSSELQEERRDAESLVGDITVMPKASSRL